MFLLYLHSVVQKLRINDEETGKVSEGEKCCKMNVNVWSRGMGGHEYRFNIQIATHIRRWPHWQITVVFQGYLNLG